MIVGPGWMGQYATIDASVAAQWATSFRMFLLATRLRPRLIHSILGHLYPHLPSRSIMDGLLCGLAGMVLTLHRCRPSVLIVCDLVRHFRGSQLIPTIMAHQVIRLPAINIVELVCVLDTNNSCILRNSYLSMEKKIVGSWEGRASNAYTTRILQPHCDLCGAYSGATWELFPHEALAMGATRIKETGRPDRKQTGHNFHYTRNINYHSSPSYARIYYLDSMEYMTTTPSLAIVKDTSPINDLSYEEMILEYIEDKHIKEYSLLDAEQLAIAQKHDTSGVAAMGNTYGGFQAVRTESDTTEEAGAEPDQLPSILAGMDRFSEDWERLHKYKGNSVTFTASDIQEICLLEDRPRRLFVEGTVDTAGDEGSSLLDGILDEILGLKGLRYLVRELSFICTLTDLPPLRPPLVQVIPICLSTIREEEPETQDLDTSFVTEQKNTDTDHPMSDAYNVCKVLSAHLGTFTVEAIEVSRDDPWSDAPTEELSDTEVPEVACADSGSESTCSEPQSGSNVVESRSGDNEDILNRAASYGITKYSMLAVRGRHGASVAFAPGILADEDASIVWPEDFAGTPGDCGVGYKGKWPQNQQYIKSAANTAGNIEE
ncbi:hypothetical protein C8Q72DRAFT_924102 [Fomitopsis betulina]|nr:hypothetical protein C8Q72DRAFT_924102 [Fomitopsis betulina]